MHFQLKYRQIQIQIQIVYFNNQHFMYTIDHNITWEFIWSIVQEWLIFGDGDPFAFTGGYDYSGEPTQMPLNEIFLQ